MPREETEAIVNGCLEVFRSQKHQIAVFGKSVRDFMESHPQLTSGDMPTIHSVRHRIKDEAHLARKLLRKLEEGRLVAEDTLFEIITDLAGVRVLHLHLEQVADIHAVIMGQVAATHWTLFEPPKAYTWDPEARKYFEGLGLSVMLRESHYTSVHYVVKPNATVSLCCEIQVRTLFEEVWGEVDHLLNYPIPTASVACKEQLLVLAKMVGAGTRLTQAIFRSHREYEERSAKDRSPLVRRGRRQRRGADADDKARCVPCVGIAARQIAVAVGD